MELVNHIRDLLYHHDCVVVPGFGGFVTNERSARIDMSTNSFYPPVRAVGFNARLDHNDGLLISYLSARLSINYIDAKKLVESFVEQVAQKFYEGRAVHFEGIGEFTTDRQKNLQFDPDPAANFLTDTYGLSFFRYPALETVEPVRRIRKKLSDTRTTGLSRRTKKILRYAAIGIPLVAALSWGAMNTGLIREFRFDLSSLNPFSAVVDSGIYPAPAAAESTDLPDTTVAGDPNELSSQRRALLYEETVREEDPFVAEPDRIAEQEEVLPDLPDLPDARPVADPAATEVVELAPEATLEVAEPLKEEVQEYVAEHISEPVEEDLAKPASPGKHYIIAGSFRNSRHAFSLREELEQEGYRSDVLDSGRDLYWVSVYSAANYSEALFMLRQVRTFSARDDAWILSR